MNRIRRISAALFMLLIAAPLFAQRPARQTDPSQLSLDTIFTYRPQSIGWYQWQSDGGGYLMLEPSAAAKDALDIVRYDAATGAKTILVSARSLTPPGVSSPLTIEEFTLSDDNQRLLIFTNSERVWRS
ncbi:MAG TPA: hypothetical protein VIC84_16335, partial [Blastocatellia bacterium]